MVGSGAKETHNVVGPFLELFGILQRQSENVAANRVRKRESKIADKIHLPAVRQGIEQALDDLLYARAHPLHRAGREGFVHQGPKPRMIRRIGKDQSFAKMPADQFKALAGFFPERRQQDGHSVSV